MSALAQPVVDVAAGDRLARRNALVLAIAQALAGGNSTVLVATAGIVGTMLAPDKGPIADAWCQEMTRPLIPRAFPLVVSAPT